MASLRVAPSNKGVAAPQSPALSSEQLASRRKTYNDSSEEASPVCQRSLNPGVK